MTKWLLLILVFLLLLAARGTAQTGSTTVIRHGSTLPTSCQSGDLFVMGVLYVNTNTVVGPCSWVSTMVSSITAPICYAAYNGNDLSNGLSPGTAKRSVMACYDALPTGGGTIFLLNGGVAGQNVPSCKTTDPAGCGIWIMGSNDPNFTSPPAGWRRTKGSVNFIGLAGTSGAAFAQGNMVTVTGGGTDAMHPNVWLSDVYSSRFSNIDFSFGHNPLYLGVDSTSNPNNTTTSSWNNTFDTDSFHTQLLVGYGPAILIGTNSDWNHFTRCSLNGNSAEAALLTGCTRSTGTVTCTSAAPLPTSWSGTMNLDLAGVSDPTFNGLVSATITGASTFTYANAGPSASPTGGYASSDAAQAMVVNPNGLSSPGTGILTIEHTWESTGGIRYYGGSGGANFYAEDIYQESGLTPPVHLVGCNSILSENQVSVKDVLIADNLANFAGFRADIPTTCAGTSVAINTSVDGPVTLGGAAGPHNPLVLPSAMGQSGTSGGRSFSQVDTSRRAFGPVALPNGVLPIPVRAYTAWSSSTGLCPTPLLASVSPVSAPDGTTLAALVIPTSGNGFPCFASVSKTIAVGDYVIVGSWVQAANGTGYANGIPIQATCISCSFSATSTARSVFVHPALGGGGEWQWVTGWGKVASTGGSDHITIVGTASSTKPTAYYGVTALYVSASTGLMDNEVAEMALHLTALNSGLVAGQVGLLPGEQLGIDSLQFTATTVVGSLPTCNPAAIGTQYIVTDASSPTWNATLTGGSSTTVLAVCDGTNWTAH